VSGISPFVHFDDNLAVQLAQPVLDSVVGAAVPAISAHGYALPVILAEAVLISCHDASVVMIIDKRASLLLDA